MDLWPSYRSGLLGSPAHAGMDPISIAPPLSVPGSPAHAGMDPRFVVYPASGARAPPHTRGWTPEVGYRAAPEAPPHTRGWTLAIAHLTPPERLPRTRGDGPSQLQPAAAAMAPPHTRGWTPQSCLNISNRVAPPHTRGWTLCAHVESCFYGSPAHAGMDPI